MQRKPTVAMEVKREDVVLFHALISDAIVPLCYTHSVSYLLVTPS